jgi:mannose-6-phosphate isomerase-like protein (cupin superfamily)
VNVKEKLNVRLLYAGLLICAFAMVGNAQEIDIYSTNKLQTEGAALAPKGPVSASKELARYKGHYLLLAKRVETGSSELHENEADIFVVESGDGAILTGGKITGGHKTAAGEIRGKSIEGATRHELHAGDVIHIPAGVAHQVLLEGSKPFVYFVVKVTGQ